MDRSGAKQGTSRTAVVTEGEKLERRRIRRLVARAGVPTADAEDVTQEVLLAIDRSSSFAVPPGVTEAEARTAWTHGVVRIQVARYRAERARTAAEQAFADPERLCPAEEQSVPSVEEDALLREHLALALKVIEGLRPDRRAVFTAYQLEEDTMADIAMTLRLRLNTAWNLLRLAREDLEAGLRKAGSSHPAIWPRARAAGGGRA